MTSKDQFSPQITPNLQQILIFALQNFSKNYFAKTALCFYLIGWSVTLFLHYKMGMMTVIITILFHSLFVLLLFSQMEFLVKEVFPISKDNKLIKSIINMGKSHPKLTIFQQIALRAFPLGILSGLGNFIYHSKHVSGYQNFGAFLSFLTIFHLTEYIFTAISNPMNLNIGSFLLNHSREYKWAMSFGLFEYFICRFLFPSYKIGSTASLSWLNYIGILSVISGEIIRKIAMVTCGTNFNHIIEDDPRPKIDYSTKKAIPKHELIQHGIYSIFRHPSYTGWFLWSIGTQLILGNLISFCAFTYASFVFFQERIPYEEETLINKFGSQYLVYRAKTLSGIPFVK